MIDNNTLLTVAEEIFNRYDLPDGATIDGQYDRVQVSYVYIDGNGLPEMQRIQRAVEGIALRQIGRSAVLEWSGRARDVDVEIHAQMQILDRNATPPRSAVEETLEAILNG